MVETRHICILPEIQVLTTVDFNDRNMIVRNTLSLRLYLFKISVVRKSVYTFDQVAHNAGSIVHL